MFHVILYEPEIPPNTGNIIRLCANTGCQLHLVHPLGFELDEKRLRRAGLDYRESAQVLEYPNLDQCLAQFRRQRVFAISTHGGATHSSVVFEPGDAFLFGPETRGLPAQLRSSFEHCLRIPMTRDSRSMNLSNSVAVVVYEALRQSGFEGLI